MTFPQGKTLLLLKEENEMREILLWNILFGSERTKKQRTGFRGLYDRIRVFCQVIIGFIIAQIVIVLIELDAIER